MKHFHASTPIGATVLAALRFWQRAHLDNEASRVADLPEWDIATGGGELAPLRSHQIDSLCETFNVDGGYVGISEFGNGLGAAIMEQGGGIPYRIADDEGPAGILSDALAMLAPVERAECYDGATAGFATMHDGRELQFQAAWGETSAALAALALVGNPAIEAMQRYCADAPAEEVGEGTWNDLDGACADGERQEQSRAAEVMRNALLALGLDAPTGHAVCSGCGREIGDGHDSDCTAPRWCVTLAAEGVQVTASSERQAERYAEGDLNDSKLGPWNVSAVVESGEETEDEDEGADWEVELQGSEPDGGETLWTFTGTASLVIIAEDADAALARALELSRCQLAPAKVEG